MRRFSLVLFTCAASLSIAAPKKKKASPPPPPVAQEEIKRALDASQSDVSTCVIVGIEPGLKTWSQVVKLKVAVNGVGQVLTLDAVLVPENANAAKTKACVEAVLRKVTWPTTHAPMVTVEREWTFAMQ